MKSARSSLVLATSWGDIIVDGEADCVVRCTLPEAEAIPREPLGSGPARRVGASGSPSFWQRVELAVRALLEGRPLTLPPLAPPTGSPFFNAIAHAMRDIPHGHTVTYGALARNAGHPGAARAVGRACGANPIPLFIPCHRVVAAGGRIGGFSSGLAWKRHLLQAEARLCV